MTALHLKASLGADIVLRPPVESDAEPLFRQVDANRAYLKQWLGWVDSCRSPEDTLEFVKRVREMHVEGTALTDVIVVQGRLVGVASIHVIDWINLNAALGYWLAEAYQGRGLITRACEAILSYMFNDLSLHRAEIRCAPDNVRSREIPKRLGFTYEGTARQGGRLDTDRYVDLEVYSMLEQEWRDRA